MKGYRTIILNVLTILAAVAAMPEFIGLIPEDWLPEAMAGFGALNIVLRFMTDTAVGRSA